MKAIEDIVLRSTQTFEVSEMAFVVESYVKDLKGINIHVVFNQTPRNAFEVILFQRQIDKLNEAFFVAQKHFINKIQNNEQ